MSSNIYEELRTDHETQRKLLNEILETQGDSDDRKRLFLALKKNLTEHAKYEERFFYSELMKSDLTMEKARHSVHEHHDIDEKIEKLDETDYKSSQWIIEAKNLKELVEHHLDEEEQEVFQLSGKALSEKQKTDLGKHYHNEMHE